MAHDSGFAPLPTSDIPALVQKLRAAFDQGRTRSVEWRYAQLDGLGRMLVEHEADIYDALKSDLGKSAIEAYTTELGLMKTEVKSVRKHLTSWMKPRRVPTPIFAQPGKCRVLVDPLGVVLVIAPWNYPFQLAIGPLIAAVAAGNCVVLKPSEVAPATSALLARLLPRFTDPECVRVVEGGIPESTALLAERFDHILYTGNGHVGRIVMEAASRHLTPVTLELGGKSPTIVDSTVDMDVAVKRIVWGKFTNAGQTCVAPDYVLVEESIKDKFLDKVKATIRDFYGDDPKASPDYGRIVNERHHRRLTALLPGSGTVAVGGEADESQRYIAPTILTDVKPDAPIMSDEIFGPILPVLTVRNVDEAIAFVNARPKPLALYVFTGDSSVADRVLSRTSSGGAIVNQTLMHVGILELPFGGVGPSGMGAYHGQKGFETFSHLKSVLFKPTALDAPIVYPPYTDFKKKWIKRLI